MKSSRKPKKITNENKWAFLQRLEYPTLALLVIGAFSLRVVGQLDKVFVNGAVWFRGVDAWYHMHLADLSNFPHFPSWDALAIYPGGHSVGYMPLLSWLVYDDVQAAFIPPILGALTLIPLYLIGKELFSRKVGLLACVFLATLPGEFLHRTLLGFTDHHALEVLLITTSTYLLLKAYRTLQWRWSIPLGVSLGLYALAWTGISFYLMIVGIWLWWEFLSKYQRKESLYPLVKVVSIPCAIALGMVATYATTTTWLMLIALILAPLALWALTSLFKDRDKVLFGLTILIPIALALTSHYINWWNTLAPVFWGGDTYIDEAQPTTLKIAVETYGLVALLALPGLWFAIRRHSFLTIWTIVIILAALGQKRWGYYAAIPASLLAAYFTFYLTKWVSKKTIASVVLVIVIFVLAVNVKGTVRLANLRNNIIPSWYNACVWLQDNTPEPVIVDGAKPNYGVLAWWDYGHWIIRIGDRAPVESPTLATQYACEFFTARSEEEANEVIKGLNLPYVMVHLDELEGKWYALLARAEDEPGTPVEERFIHTLWNNQATTWTQVEQIGNIKIFERSDTWTP